jgi:hypothetical protein
VILTNALLVSMQELGTNYVNQLLKDIMPHPQLPCLPCVILASTAIKLELISVLSVLMVILQIMVLNTVFPCQEAMESK